MGVGGRIDGHDHRCCHSWMSSLSLTLHLSFNHPQWLLLRFHRTKENQGTLQVGKIREGETPTLKITQEQPEIHRTTGTRYNHRWLSQQPLEED